MSRRIFICRKNIVAEYLLALKCVGTGKMVKDVAQ